jgi:hypothetical protein
MEQVKINMLERTIKQLNALGVQYAVIDFSGKKLGTLEIAEKNRRRRNPNPEYKWGEMTGYVRSNLPVMEVGDVTCFSADKYDINRIRATTCAVLIDKYGKGSCATIINKKSNTVEVLRIS